MIDALPEPTKSIITLMVVGSLRIGEVAALRWERIHSDRIEIVERFYEGEFDDTKTDAGPRSIALDSHGILRSVLDAVWQRSKYRKPNDLVFTNAKGGPVNRRNLLRRHLKPTVKKLGLPETVDFRSFRTMHSSLMWSWSAYKADRVCRTIRIKWRWPTEVRKNMLARILQSKWLGYLAGVLRIAPVTATRTLWFDKIPSA